MTGPFAKMVNSDGIAAVGLRVNAGVMETMARGDFSGHWKEIFGAAEEVLKKARGVDCDEIRVVLEDVKSDGSIKYHRDSDQTHYVPKRKRDELIVKMYG